MEIHFEVARIFIVMDEWFFIEQKYLFSRSLDPLQKNWHKGRLSMSDIMDKITNHLEFLGYEIEPLQGDTVGLLAKSNKYLNFAFMSFIIAYNGWQYGQ